MMPTMRTTVTLEKDVERLLRDAMHRSRKSFKHTLNAALRTGLGGKTAPTKAKRFVVEARPLGLRAGIDPAGFNKLADDFEVDAFLEKHARTKKS
ncbi:antitoxin VapB33 [Verrucomicrobiota bacterium]|nr:antitoxin VapB33 [Verrucomicrobiota bacterium]